MQSGLIFTTSPWLTLLCVATGALYAWGLYAPLPSWSRLANRALAALRGLLVAIICFLLLAPRVRHVETSVDKARIVVAVDNSMSMASAADSSILRKINSFKERLENAGYEVAGKTLSGANSLDSLRFDEGTTDLSGFLNSVRGDFEGRHLTDVILLSDGIYNQGASPAFGVYPFRIHSLAVGDTVPARDIRITQVRANQVAFLGNQFPVQADITAHGMSGRRATISLRQGARLLASKELHISRDNHFETVEFLVSSSEKGMQRFTLDLNVLPGERTQAGNKREVYVDIIDGRENILLLALSPHPDLKAIRSIISTNENYDLDIHVMSIGAIPAELLKKKYDLLILHQIPDLYNMGNGQEVRTLLGGDTPAWYIYGSQSASEAFNKVNRNVTITTEGAQFDQVAGRLNKAFNTVLLDPGRLSLLEKLPPIAVPFGEYALVSGTEVVLYQHIGNLETRKPLLTVRLGGESKKTAAFLGDGLWLWRQEEFAQTGKTEVIDEMMLKLIQLMSVKEDKRKFRVTPVEREFSTREPVVLQTEVYNDVYEKIYGQEITLKVTDEKNRSQTYTYVNAEGQPHYQLSGLAEGAYRFIASTRIKDKTEEVEGRFLVRDVNLEHLNMTADHGMLRELSAKSGGEFLYPDGLDKLQEELVTLKSPDRLNSREEVAEIIHLKWLFFLLVALAALEWATRKYLGGY